MVVDADCDVHDYAEVAWRAFGNVDYAHDVLHTVGPVDHLDHASYEQFFGGKLGIDATRKLPTEGYRREGGWPTECVLDAGDAGPGRAPLARVPHQVLVRGQDTVRRWACPCAKCRLPLLSYARLKIT